MNQGNKKMNQGKKYKRKEVQSKETSRSFGYFPRGKERFSCFVLYKENERKNIRETKK